MKSWEPWGGAEQAPGAVSLQEGFPELEPGERMSVIGRAGRGGGGQEWTPSRTAESSGEPGRGSVGVSALSPVTSLTSAPVTG